MLPCPRVIIEKACVLAWLTFFSLVLEPLFLAFHQSRWRWKKRPDFFGQSSPPLVPPKFEREIIKPFPNAIPRAVRRNTRPSRLDVRLFVRDIIANFCIAWWVQIHPNADTFRYFFLSISQRQWICNIVISLFFNKVIDF